MAGATSFAGWCVTVATRGRRRASIAVLPPFFGPMIMQRPWVSAVHPVVIRPGEVPHADAGAGGSPPRQVRIQSRDQGTQQRRPRS